ncbi:signal peptidase I [Ruminococcaceae bacterium OttesenSCG-928-A16]|nr:signal peptidase I [Ruminococcaceae bacterium OttesenSCG-928-A16]
MDQQQRERNIAVLEWFDAIVFALTIVLIILLFLVRTVRVDGTSMVPTLENGDQLIARSILYEPQRGDVVVIDGYIEFGAPLVKRVIGTEGDVVDIDFEQGQVFVNGQLLTEPYISAPTTRSFDVTFPVTVPEGHLFLMGDNRPNSKDSRDSDIGMIDKRDVLGKVVFRLVPFNKFGGIE